MLFLAEKLDNVWCSWVSTLSSPVDAQLPFSTILQHQVHLDQDEDNSVHQQNLFTIKMTSGVRCTLHMYLLLH